MYAPETVTRKECTNASSFIKYFSECYEFFKEQLFVWPFEKCTGNCQSVANIKTSWSIEDNFKSLTHIYL